MLPRIITVVLVLLLGSVAAWSAGLVALFAIAQSTTATAGILAGVLGAVVVVAGATIWTAMRIRGQWNKIPIMISGAIVAIAPFALLAGMHVLDALRTKPTGVPDTVISELERFTHPLGTVDPGGSRDELDAFRDSVRGKRIVALGEATHGTSEFFRLKHRLLKYLVEELQFRHFAMEVHPEQTGRLLNAYVQGESVDPRRVLYWPWATHEYLEMLDWLRAHNASVPEDRRVMLHGIDPVEGERDRIMAGNVTRMAELHHSGIVVWAANSHVHGIAGGMGQYLRNAFGDAVYLVGLEFHEGSFTSRFGQVHEYRAGPFGPEYYSHALAQLAGEVRFIDFDEASRSDTVRDWLEEPRYTNSMYEIYAVTRWFPHARADTLLKHRLAVPIRQRFDGLMFVRTSTPASALPHTR